MSGDVTGVIIGGAATAGAIPVIAAGIVIAGAVVGVRAVSKGMKRRREQFNLEVYDCSEDMKKTYQMLDKALRDQASANERYRAGLQQDMERYAARLEQRREQIGQSWRGELRADQAEASRHMQVAAKRHQEQLKAQLHRQTEQCLAQIADNQRAMAALVNWESKRAEDAARQKSVAASVMRDANATVELLERLCKGGAFDSRADALRKNAKTVRQAFEAQQYQLAVSVGQMIVTQGASLALTLAETQQLLSERRGMLAAQTEGMLARIDYSRQIAFVDEYYQEEEHVDLDGFCQGQIVRLEGAIKALRESIARAQTQEELTLLAAEAERRSGELDEAIEVACEQLTQYYKRLHMMEKLQDFMLSQNYDCDWCTEAGADHTQEMVVSFTHRTTGNRISLSLDEAPGGNDQVTVNLYTFDDADPISERERAALRRSMVSALAQSGMQGELSCAGRVNQPSAQTQYSSPEQVEAQTPIPLFFHSRP